MKSYLLISGILLFVGFGARAQDMSPLNPKPDGLELTCRTKAKEAANQAYRSCMFESKSTQIEQVRKDYQVRLNQIKAEYEAELGRISGKAPKKQEKKAPAPTEQSEPTIEIRADDKQDVSFHQSLPQGKKLGKAVLFSDGQDAPEPIPLEKIKSSSVSEN